MKFILSSIFLFSQIAVFSQNWFSQDDHWVYDSSGFLYKATTDITVGSDTLLLGKEAKILDFFILDADDIDLVEAQRYQKIAYEEEGKVYIYSNATGNFELNYDFNLIPGESIFYDVSTIIPSCEYTFEYKLDSLSTVVVNSETLVVQHFSVYDQFGSSGYKKIIEKIGCAEGFEIASNHIIYCIQDAAASYLCSFNDSNELVPESLESYCSQVISSVVEQDISVHLFPNPTNGIMLIESEIEFQSIEVMDMHGSQLLQFTQSDHIDVSSLSSGIYFLTINTNTNSRTFRIIKN